MSPLGHVRLGFADTDEWLTLSQVQAVTDLGAWARAAAERFAPRRRDRQDLTTYFRRLGEHYLEVGGTGCLFLLPGGRAPVRAMVRLETFSGPGTAQEAREQVELLFPPIEWLVDPVAVTSLATGAGPASRLHLRFADPGSDATSVRETVLNLWWFADVPETMLLSVAFADADEAAQWLGHVDALALTAGRTNGPPAAETGQRDGDYVGAAERPDPERWT